MQAPRWGLQRIAQKPQNECHIAITYDDELVLKFRTVHGCKAQFLHTLPVREVFEGNRIWDGAVWLFKLTGHPKAQFGYAWLRPNAAGDDLEITTVLEIPPVDPTPRTVRPAMLASRPTT